MNRILQKIADAMDKATAANARLAGAVIELRAAEAKAATCKTNVAAHLLHMLECRKIAAQYAAEAEQAAAERNAALAELHVKA